VTLDAHWNWNALKSDDKTDESDLIVEVNTTDSARQSGSFSRAARWLFIASE
jgi:hypothetical protein